VVTIKKTILIFCFVLALSFFCVNASFDVTYTIVNDRITWGQEAKFNLTITNKGNFKDTYSIYYPDVLWMFHTIPREESSITLEPNETKTVLIALKPLYIEQLGQYVVPLSVKSIETNELKQVKVKIDLQSPEDLKSYYLPSVKVYIDMPKEINPSEDLTIKIRLSNRNPLNLTNLRVVLTSSIINQESNLSLGPLHSKNDEKTIIFTPKLDPKTKPITEDLTIDILKGDRKIGSIKKRYSIVEYSSITLNKEKSSERKGFLSFVGSYIYYNKGNVEKKDIIKIETNLWRKLFTSVYPKTRIIKENGKIYYNWNVSLKPYEEFSIVVKVNYRPLLYIFLLGIVWVVLYFLYRSPVVVKKKVVEIKTREGGISSLKVLLNLKNRTKDIIDDVVIIDRVPSIANVSEQEGPLLPSKVIKQGKGTIMRWEIKELDGFEERVISYKIKSRLSILGSFRLPKAVVRFKTKQGIYKKVRSNSVVLRV